MKKMIQKVAVFTIIVTLFLTSCSKDKQHPGKVENLSNEIVLKWNEVAFNAFGGASYQHSLMASRINAMVHLAMHDALNAIQPKYETYALTQKDTAADAVTAAAVAAHAVLLHELPARKPFLDSALVQSLATIVDGDAKIRGIEMGKKAAQAIISYRENDGAPGELVTPVPPSTVPGNYQGVPPFNFVFAPHWENVKLFSLQAKDQFRPISQPSLNSAKYTTDFNEVKELGKLNSATRTADQSASAKFWYEFSEAGWNRVTRVAAANKKLNLLETARLFALVDIAMADAYIAGWDAKLHFNFWRPYTAIRFADADGNAATAQDALWEPAEPTPPVQDYPSTHSALGNAAATVLARIMGDNTAFTMTSFTAIPAGSTRTYSSFTQAANANAESRVIAGIHFRFSCKAGQELGTKIGNWVIDNQLKPLE